MYNGDGVKKEDILKLNTVSCRNKVVLNPYDVDYSLSYVFNFLPDGSDMLSMRGMNKNIFGVQSIIRKFDFVNFLNTK